MASAKYPFFSSYPRVCGVVYALKSDTIPDKRISLALASGNEWEALRIALETTARRHRYIALCLYFLTKRLHWLPPLAVTLWFCRIIGPANSWFEYLQRSSTRPSLLTATSIYTQLFSKNKKETGYILDLGCGLGQLPQRFPRQPHRRWICVDKNFFSLFLAQLYHRRSDIIYACADVEIQHLFPKSFFSSAVCIDCFDFIYQKDSFLRYIAQILKKGGTFVMMNIHEEQPGTELWGYGINRTEVKKLLLADFQKITWHDLNFPLHSQKRSLREVDSMRYSFVAYK